VNGSTNVQVIGGAGAFALIVIWLLSFFFPELMETAPTGLEAGLTVLFTIGAGVMFKPDAGIKSLPGTGEN